MDFQVTAFLASESSYLNGILIGPPVFPLVITSSETVTITSTDNLLDTSDTLNTDAGGTFPPPTPFVIEDIEFRTISLAGTDYDVAVIFPANSSQVVIVPIDGGAVSTDPLPVSSGYSVSQTQLTVPSLALEPASGGNTAPVAQPLSLTTDENVAVMGTVVATDADNDPLSFSVDPTDGPANGSVAFGMGGALTYTPDAGFDGTDDFTILVSDGTDTTPATVTVTVNDVPMPTTVTVASYVVADGDLALALGLGTLTVDATTLIEAVITSADATLGTGDTADTQADNGTLIDEEISEILFRELTLNGNTVTVAILRFDGSGENLIVPLDIAAGEVAGIPLDTGDYALGGPLPDPMATLVDTQITPTSVTVASYVVADGDLNLALGTGTLTVDANTLIEAVITSNDDTLSTGDTADTQADNGTLANEEISEVLIRELTLNGNTVTVAILRFDGSGENLIVPLDIAAGEVAGIPLDTGDYALGGPLPDPGFLLVDTQINNAPVAQPLSLTTDEDMAVMGTVVATDADNDPLTFSVDPSDGPSNGSVAFGIGGALTYTPDAGFDGTDDFTVLVSDGIDTTPAAVTVTVLPPPTIVTVASYVVADGDLNLALGTGTLTVDATTLIEAVITSADATLGTGDTADTQADNGTLIDEEISEILFRELTLNGNTVTVAILRFDGSGENLIVPLDIAAGEVAGIPLDTGDYALGGPLPDPMATLVDTQITPTSVTVASYVVADGDLNLALGTGTLTVDANTLIEAVITSNDDTLSTGDTADTQADNGTLANEEISEVLIRELTLNGNTVTVAILRFDGSGENLIVPLDIAAGEVAGIPLDTGDYALGGPLPDPGFLLVDTQINNAPVAQPLSLTTDEDMAVMGTVVATDADNDPLTFSVDPSDGPANGSVAFGMGGALTYTPDADFNGTDDFTILVSDGIDTATSTVTVTVNPVNDAPEAANVSATTDEDTPVSFDLLGSDVDAADDQSTLTYTIVNDEVLDACGNNFFDAVTITPTGELEFDPLAGANAGIVNALDAGESLTLTFSYTATDSENATSNTATGTITVTGITDTVGQTFFGDSSTQVFGGTPGLVDTVDFSTAAGPANAVQIFITGADGDTSTGSSGDALGDLFISIDNIIGSAFNDIIVMSSTAAVDNVVDGGGGSDFIIGGLGKDELIGGLGNDILDGTDGGTMDILNGGDGLDIVQYSQSGAGIVYDLGNPTAASNSGEILADQLISIEGIIGAKNHANQLTGDDQDNRLVGGNQADILTGNGGNDVIAGFDGDDEIDGGDGIDILLGQAGVDILTGGAGADTFDIVLNSETEIITDFNTAENDMVRFFGTGLQFADLNFSTNGSDVDVTVTGQPDLLITFQNQDINVINDASNFNFI